jgi:NhaP-type Na+/H+ or K+/H+ antiporter
MNDITPSDLAVGRRLKIGAVAAPPADFAPAIITFILLLFAASGPPVAAVILFAGIIAMVFGFIAESSSRRSWLKRSVWTREMRERTVWDLSGRDRMV